MQFLPHLVADDDLQAYDDEFREIQNIQWTSFTHFDNAEEFWGDVLSNRRMDGSLAYSKLYEVIPVLLRLPHSSAAVERIFSIYNSNKTKTRNRLLTETMQGVLAAREYLRNHKDESGNTEVNEEARRRFSNTMYKSNTK